MNNPLIYTDPDGELIWLIVGAVVGAYLGGVIAEQGQLNPEQWAWDETTWKGIGIGLASGALLGGAVDLLIAGELGLSLGASTPAGKASVDLLNSDIELYWTNSAGGGGSINLTKEEYNRSLTAGPGGSSGGYYNPYGAPSDGMWDLNGDGMLQKNEADNWWLNGKGQFIRVDNSKIDWTGLTIPDGRSTGDIFSISTTDAFKKLPYETAATYGGTSFEVINPSTVMVIDQSYHYNYRPYNSGENVIRNFMNWYGKPSGQGVDYKIYYYNRNIQIK